MNLNWLTHEIILLLCQGCIFTIILTAVTSIFSLALGLAIGAARLQKRPLWSYSAAIYVELWRNIPALVLIIFFAFAIPNLWPAELRRTLFFNNLFINWLGEWTRLSIPYYLLAAILALTLNTSAYLAEIFRAGVNTIAQEQVETARTLGASSLAIFGQILLPQGLQAAFPAISTRLIHNMKNTALAAFVSIPELFHTIETAITRTFRALELLVLAAILYLLLSLLFAKFLRSCERWLNRYVAPRDRFESSSLGKLNV